MSFSFPWRVVDSPTERIASMCSSVQAMNCPASWSVAKANAGARVTPSFTRTAAHPPASVMSCAPREYDATSAASVVASGTWYNPDAHVPFTSSGPATPTGVFTVPMNDSTL